MESGILVFVWLGLIIVNTGVAQEKGISVWAALIFSIIAAPIVYLYVLAAPARDPKAKKDAAAQYVRWVCPKCGKKQPEWSKGCTCGYLRPPKEDQP